MRHREKILLMIVIVAALCVTAWAGSVQAAPPVSVWAFEGASPTVATDSADGNDGTIQNGASRVTAGSYDQALSVSSAGFGVDVPDSDNLDFTGSFSVQAWINPTVETPAGKVFLKFATTTGWAMDLSSNGKLTFSIWSTGGDTLIRASDNFWIPEGSWTHVAAAYDASTDLIHLYKNGTRLDALAGTTTNVGGFGSPVANTGALELGDFNGMIDEMGVFDSAVATGDNYTAYANSLIPEPVTLSILAVAGLAILARRRR